MGASSPLSQSVKILAPTIRKPLRYQFSVDLSRNDNLVSEKISDSE